jgi:hypothetical protein
VIRAHGPVSVGGGPVEPPSRPSGMGSRTVTPRPRAAARCKAGRDVADRCFQLRTGTTRAVDHSSYCQGGQSTSVPGPVRRMLSVEAAPEKLRAAGGDGIARRRRRRFIP